jgi:phosphoglycerate dehydrogenase-like enzyme
MESFLPRASAADVIVIALPLTPATTRVVDAEFLARLRPGAVIVNAGRGALVDTEALMRAAQAGQICGILDVVDPEPLPEGHPLWTSRGITITPHIAGAVPDVWPRSWKRAVNNLQAFAAGRDPEDLTEES